MKDVIQLLLSKPESAITVLALFLCAALGLALYRRVLSDFGSFRDHLKAWEVRASGHMSTTNESLAMHAESLGKATKAINGDALRIKESIFNLKQELSTKVEELREVTARLEREFKLVALVMKASASQFEEQVGKVVANRKTLDELRAKVSDVELGIDQADDNFAAFKRLFEITSKTVTDLRKEIDELRKKT